jgi:two-component system chemotaxis sensor kinase CheA
MDLLSKEDSEFYNKLLASFKIESEEHVRELASGLCKIEKGLQEDEFENQLHSMFRAAHSLKGAARAVNLVCIETICQSMEDVFSKLKKNKTKLSPALVSTLYESIDILEDLIHVEKDSLVTLEATNHSELLEKLDKYINVSAQVESTSAPPKKMIEENKVSHLLSKNQEANQTIRTSSAKIDMLLQHVEEMLMIKLSSEQKVHSLKYLQTLFSQGEKQFRALNAEKVILSFCEMATNQKENEKIHNLSNQLSIYFDSQKQFLRELGDSLNKIRQHCEQDHRAICGMVDSVLDDTKEILMLPLSTILESFPRMLRDLSKSLGKEVLLTIVGAEIEIDRRILEQLKDPLVHILRNSIDHGIEPPAERKTNKKQIQGNIKISAFQVSGNLVNIVIEDDGRGIDIEKIKEIAIRNGYLPENKAKNFSEKEALGLVFHAGFSTSSKVTEISGRGIGMSVLAENIEKLGGKVSLESKLKEGTTIDIHLPLTLATFRGIHIQISGQDYIMPTHHVCRVFRITEDQIKKIENRQMLAYEGKSYSYLPLKEILNLPTISKNEREDILILMIKASEIILAIGIDRIIAEQEIFIKSLGSQLKQVPYISSATIMEWGKVIPILNPFELVKAILKNPSIQAQTVPLPQKKEKSIRTVLIAEDSATSRMLLKNILESAGYIVKSAVDGIEAFSILGTEKIDLLLSDVEMPKMDGFELTAKVRNTENLKNLPIVLCTSLGSKEDRERGVELGANAYLDKSGFMQSNLLEVLEQLL